MSSLGPVRSVQEAELTVPEGESPERWHPVSREALERVAAGYWVHLRRISLGFLKVVDEEGSRSIALGSRRLVLLRFQAPRYDVGPGFGRVTLPIDRGLLVAPEGRGRGHLRFEVRRDERGSVRVRAVVSSYYPSIRGSRRFARLGAFVYSQTQARVHVLVTRGFLREL